MSKWKHWGYLQERRMPADNLSAVLYKTDDLRLVGLPLSFYRENFKNN